MIIKVTLNKEEIEALLLEDVSGFELGEHVPDEATVTFRSKEKEPGALPLAPIHETPRVKDQDEIRSEMETIAPDDIPF